MSVLQGHAHIERIIADAGEFHAPFDLEPAVRIILRQAEYTDSLLPLQTNNF
jgi:hypothetical protein